jgi:hypothetical protein
MTSRRDVLERHFTDELERVIRWVLRESVTGAEPSPHVWGRIVERVARPSTRGSMGLRSFRGYWPVRARLSRVDAFLSAQVASWTWPGNENRWEWRQDPCFTRFLDQHAFQLQLAF